MLLRGSDEYMAIVIGVGIIIRYFLGLSGHIYLILEPLRRISKAITQLNNLA